MKTIKFYAYVLALYSCCLLTSTELRAGHCQEVFNIFSDQAHNLVSILKHPENKCKNVKESEYCGCILGKNMSELYTDSNIHVDKNKLKEYSKGLNENELKAYSENVINEALMVNSRKLFEISRTNNLLQNLFGQAHFDIYSKLKADTCIKNPGKYFATQKNDNGKVLCDFEKNGEDVLKRFQWAEKACKDDVNCRGNRKNFFTADYVKQNVNTCNMSNSDQRKSCLSSFLDSVKTNDVSNFNFELDKVKDACATATTDKNASCIADFALENKINKYFSAMTKNFKYMNLNSITDLLKNKELLGLFKTKLGRVKDGPTGEEAIKRALFEKLAQHLIPNMEQSCLDAVEDYARACNHLASKNDVQCSVLKDPHLAGYLNPDKFAGSKIEVEVRRDQLLCANSNNQFSQFANAKKFGNCDAKLPSHMAQVPEKLGTAVGKAVAWANGGGSNGPRERLMNLMDDKESYDVIFKYVDTEESAAGQQAAAPSSSMVAQSSNQLGSQAGAGLSAGLGKDTKITTPIANTPIAAAQVGPTNTSETGKASASQSGNGATSAQSTQTARVENLGSQIQAAKQQVEEKEQKRAEAKKSGNEAEAENLLEEITKLRNRISDLEIEKMNAKRDLEAKQAAEAEAVAAAEAEAKAQAVKAVSAPITAPVTSGIPATAQVLPSASTISAPVSIGPAPVSKSTDSSSAASVTDGIALSSSGSNNQALSNAIKSVETPTKFGLVYNNDLKVIPSVEDADPKQFGGAEFFRVESEKNALYRFMPELYRFELASDGSVTALPYEEYLATIAEKEEEQQRSPASEGNERTYKVEELNNRVRDDRSTPMSTKKLNNMAPPMGR